MQLPALGHACDYATPLIAAFLQLEEQYGKETAVREANIQLSSLLLRFNLRLNDPAVIARTQALLVHPLNLRALDIPIPEQPIKDPVQVPTDEKELKRSLCIYYGSYTKTCQNLAERLKADAEKQDLKVLEIEPLDALVKRVPQKVAVFIITSTIHSGPPPNARHFVAWLEKEKEKGTNSMEGVNFAVFGSGAGSRSQEKYQANAIKINKLMVDLGANKLIERGEGNAEGSTRRDFSKWKTEHFWPHFGITDPSPISSEVDLIIRHPVGPINPEFDYQLGTAEVEDAILLTDPTLEKKEQKWHIKLKLPTDLTYTTGDYLSVMPVNPRETVKRAMILFEEELGKNAVLDIREGGLVLPKGKNLDPLEILSRYVELRRLALEDDLIVLAQHATNRTTKDMLLKLALDPKEYETKVLDLRMSPLDLLEKYKKNIKINLETFLSILPPMEYRQYSISSSPLPDKTICTLSVALMYDKHLGTKPNADFQGACSTYLSRLRQYDTIKVGIVKSNEFHLPEDKTPILMICAGTGVAPFRAFIEERSYRKSQNASLQLGEALLFIGCRYHDKDRIHGEDFDKWQEEGVVTVKYAFSREIEKSYLCQYVQDRVWHDRKEVAELLDKGAEIYVCGSGKIGKEARTILTSILLITGKKEQDIDNIFDKRLHEDVFE